MLYEFNINYIFFINFNNYLFFDFYNIYFFNFFFSLDYIFLYYFPYLYIFIIITLVAIIFCLMYNWVELKIFLFYIWFIFNAGYVLFYTDSLILFFLAYEFLLFPSLFILYRFAKTRRCVEAAFLMFFWTQFGALFLIYSFLYLFLITGSSSFLNLYNYVFSEFEINFLFFCWFIGFGVKIPIWPFYGWLPRAHVEASTNFSIFLSGVLVKFAFFGFLKCLMILTLEPTFIIVYPFLLIGLTDAVFKLFYQIDIKKLVAYATVVEMHWLLICIISGQSCLWLAGFCMLISHAILSSNAFLIVDSINRRFKTRLITEINGINFLTPKLFLVALTNLIIFTGFPGSLFFIAEFLFFSFIFDFFPLLMVFLLVLVYFFLPTFFLKNWMNVLFGNSRYIKNRLILDLDLRETLLYLFLVLLVFWLGLTWQFFIF